MKIKEDIILKNRPLIFSHQDNLYIIADRIKAPKYANKHNKVDDQLSKNRGVLIPLIVNTLLYAAMSPKLNGRILSNIFERNSILRLENFNTWNIIRTCWGK